MPSRVYSTDEWIAIEELLRLASNSQKPGPDSAEVQRWRRLFEYSHFEAIYLLQEFLKDVTRYRMTDSEYELMAAILAANGHSRLSWEHLNSLKHMLDAHTRPTTDRWGNSWTLLRLGGFLTFVERVMEIAKLRVKPICEQMVGGNGEAITVAWVDNYSMGKIYEWVDQRMVPVRDAASRLKKAEPVAEDSNVGVGTSVDNPPH
ncbi:hypothetical protein F5882DRAFT_480850 [Hyaloscypha sp. PMI_1271]|nr:hypothetical protein F5882DRAFT_480850 [Hyaloscypha sp. PMI_1271]